MNDPISVGRILMQGAGREGIAPSYLLAFRPAFVTDRAMPAWNFVESTAPDRACPLVIWDTNDAAASAGMKAIDAHEGLLAVVVCVSHRPFPFPNDPRGLPTAVITDIIVHPMSNDDMRRPESTPGMAELAAALGSHYLDPTDPVQVELQRLADDGCPHEPA